MKLWLLLPLNQDKEPFSGYDVALGFVVCAKSEKKARDLAQKHGGDERRASPWRDSRLVSCVELTPEGPEGIVLRDFRAG